MSHRPSPPDTLVNQVAALNGRKFLIKKIALSAATAVRTNIGTTDALGNTLPTSYTLVIQPIGTDIYYELREAGTTSAITDVTSTRPGFKISDSDSEVANILPPGADLIPVAGVGDGSIDIYPVSAGNALLFWTV